MVQLQAVPLPQRWWQSGPNNEFQLTLEAHDFLLQLWRRTGGHTDYISEGLASRLPIAITVTGDVTMSAERDTAGDEVEQKYGIVILEGAPGSAFDVNFSDNEGRYFIVNDTDAVATIKTATDTTGVALAVGRVDDFAFDADYTVRNLQHITATARFLGRDDAGAGPVEELTANEAFDLLAAYVAARVSVNV